MIISGVKKLKMEEESMKRHQKIISLVFLVVGIFFNYSFVFGNGWEQPSGEPPRGLAIQNDAQGIKLNGVMFIEYQNYNFSKFTAENAKVVVRLRKGTQLEGIFGSVPGPLNASDPAGVQAAIITYIAPLILQKFFPGENVTITLKRMEEYRSVDGEWIMVTPKKGPSYPLGTKYIVADIELAIQ